jgi:hypothetical protein
MGETTASLQKGRAEQGFPRRPRTPRAPRLWFEVLLTAVSYWTYSLIRNAVPERRGEALRNTDWVWGLERHLGIAVEDSVNHTVNSVTWLIVGMNYYYATLHFLVTVGVLAWLYKSHPGRYGAARTALFATTGVALLGYYLFPLAPPRLMPGGGFVDTVVVHRTWGSMASGDLKDMSNQYAAMPSMHIGWALWCGLTIFALARLPWVRILGLLYPAATLVVIVATANHFWLDAVGGVLCLALGFGVAAVWYGARPYALPRLPAVPSSRTVASGRGTPATAPGDPAEPDPSAPVTAAPVTAASEPGAGAEGSGVRGFPGP